MTFNAVVMTLLIGAVLLAVGFSVLQRRKPDEADKVAGELSGFWNWVRGLFKRAK
jgi:hypothetical protein